MYAKRLAELRKTRDGLTQEKLANILGVTQQAVGRWEKGLNKPDNDILVKLADFYHVSIDYILGRNTTAEDMKAILMQPKEDKPSPVKQMLDLYHKLTPEKKKQARSYIAFLAQDNNMV